MELSEAITRLHEADAALSAANPQPFPLPLGGLAPVVAGAVLALQRGDWWVPGLRERVGAVLRDVPVERLVDGLAGARPYQVAPPTPSPALRALHAVGLAQSNRNHAALVHLGIGSASDGAFYEALNLAALLQPTVLFVVAIHPLDGDAPVPSQVAGDPEALAQALNLPTTGVDGTDVQAVYDAVHAAREAGGPHLIAARLGPAKD
jgi:pyruvate dehydrogenase E1 component alpha subunit